MKNLTRFLPPTILFLAILSSCKSIPKDVQDDIDTYEAHPTDEQADQNSPNYDTFENIIANTPTSLNKKIGNVLFDGIIRVPETNTLSELTLEYSQSFYTYHVDIFSFLQPEGTILDKSLIVDPVKLEIKAGTLDPSGEYWNARYYNNGNTYISIGEAGFLVNGPITAKKSEDNPEGYFDYPFFPVEEIIQCYRGEPLNDDPRPVREGELSLKQAAQDVLDFFNSETWKQWENDEYTYMIRTAFVRKVDDVYGYEFCIERMYNGVNLDATSFYEAYEDPADLERRGNIRRLGTPILVLLSGLDGPSSWLIRSENSYTVAKETPLDGPFITFDAALETACGAISRGAHITIRSAELCYDVGYRGYVSLYEEHTVREFYSMPVWAFIIDNGSISPSKNGHDPHWTIFVNAVNGEVYVYDNPPGY